MFVEEYLVDLRRERYAPRALFAYARRVGQRVRTDVMAMPGAVRSIWSVALGYFVAAFAGAAAIALRVDRHLAIEFFMQTSVWLVLAFGLVTAHVGALRDRAGFRLSSLNVPTTLTLFRVVAAPGVALFLAERQLALALALYAVAALTDVADGWIARRTGQITRLGVMIDPIVDIVFNLTVFAGLAAGGLLPAWVFVVAAVRYGLLLVGGAAMYVFAGPMRIRPTTFGRLTGVIMTALVALIVVLQAPAAHFAPALAPLTEIALGALMVATVGQVVALGWFNLRTLQGRAGAEPQAVDEARWGA